MQKNLIENYFFHLEISVEACTGQLTTFFYCWGEVVKDLKIIFDFVRLG
jgi:hypothetical protein